MDFVETIESGFFVKKVLPVLPYMLLCTFINFNSNKQLQKGKNWKKAKRQNSVSNGNISMEIFFRHN